MTTKTAPYIKVKNIAPAIDSANYRNSLSSIIYPNGNYVYLVGGNEVDGRSFEEQNPITEMELNRIDKGNSLDGRTNWL